MPTDTEKPWRAERSLAKLLTLDDGTEIWGNGYIELHPPRAGWRFREEGQRAIAEIHVVIDGKPTIGLAYHNIKPASPPATSHLRYDGNIEEWSAEGPHGDA